MIKNHLSKSALQYSFCVIPYVVQLLKDNRGLLPGIQN